MGALSAPGACNARCMDLEVSPALTIPASELGWRFSRSSGPGGQHVNTSDSRVELSWNVAELGGAFGGPTADAGHAPRTTPHRRGDHRDRLRAALPAAQPRDRPGQARRTSWQRALPPRLPAAGRPNPPGARTAGASPQRNSGRRRNSNAAAVRRVARPVATVRMCPSGAARPVRRVITPDCYAAQSAGCTLRDRRSISVGP